MPRDLPIACSLSAAELPQRLADMAAIGRADLLSSHAAGGRALLRFRRGPDTRRRLEAIVAAEAECCAFLTMELGETADAVELGIGAPDGAEPVLDDIVAAFTG
jgi:hypothetical protein